MCVLSAPPTGTSGISVKAGRFREDLYYRIACLAVRLPPLRERLDDIELLAPNLLERISGAMSATTA